MIAPHAPPAGAADDGGPRVHVHAPPEAKDRGGAGVVVLPIQGGDYDVSTYFADGLAAAGLRCLRFERRAEWLEPERPVEAMPELVRAYLADIRAGTDRWIDAGGVDPARLGLLGVSMGAKMGTLAMGTDKRFKAGVLALGGADMPGVLATGHDTELNAWRAAVCDRLGMDPPALRRHLDAIFDGVDAADLAPELPTDRIWMVQARFDRVVRYPFQRRLWEAMGRPRRTVLPCGHYSAAVFAGWIRRRAADWLRRHLA